MGQIFLVHPKTTLIHDVDGQDLSGVTWTTIKRKRRNAAGLTLSPSSPAGPLSPCKDSDSVQCHSITAAR